MVHSASPSSRGVPAEAVLVDPSPLARHVETSSPAVFGHALRTGVRAMKDLVKQAVSLVYGDLDLTSLLVGRVDVNRLLDRVDVAALVERLEMVPVVDKVDVDDVVARLDLDALVERLDLDALVERIDVGMIVEHLDLDAIVSRLDMDALVARLDVDAIVRRIDVVGLVGHLAQQSSFSTLIPGLPRRSRGTSRSDPQDPGRHA